MTRTLIRNGYVVTMNRQRDVFSAGSLVINGAHIEKVEPGDAQPEGPFENVIDASGMIVIPGLINAHQHFYYHLFKGLANGLLIEEWFPELVFKVIPHLTDDDMELTSYLANIEMLLSGTTCSLNHLRLASTEATLEKLSRPAIELGSGRSSEKRFSAGCPETRAIHGLFPKKSLSSRSSFHSGKAVPTVSYVFVSRSSAMRSRSKRGCIREELLVECKKLADRLGLKVSTHHAAGTLSFDKSYLQTLAEDGTK